MSGTTSCRIGGLNPATSIRGWLHRKARRAVPTIPYAIITTVLMSIALARPAVAQPDLTFSFTSPVLQHGHYSMTVDIENTGDQAARKLTIESATLNSIRPTSPRLPDNLGTLAPDKSHPIKLTYPRSVGSPGATVEAGISGQYVGANGSTRTFNITTLVTLQNTQALHALITFNEANGANPIGDLIQDGQGNLYGTSYDGGASGYGIVFKLDPAGNETVLYSFTGGSDGGYPEAGLIRDAQGNLYGTASGGGLTGSNEPNGAGVVFKLDPAGNFSVLYRFTGGTDGAAPFAGLIQDTQGNLYGTTNTGGASGYGVVFKLDSSGNETVLYSFTGGSDGGNPEAGVIMDAQGNLYGTTNGGGIVASERTGVVFKLDPAGNETVLHSFTGSADGAAPIAGVIMDAQGNLYGTTFLGGNTDSNRFNGPYGAGVVYKLDPAGNETVLHTFAGDKDGGYPQAGVIMDAQGNLYGTTTYGGIANGYNGAGVVFELDPAGNEIVLHAFSGDAQGAYPWSGVILDAQGNLYGTTEFGGIGYGFAGAGVVFKIMP